jgi:hypothetical protein
MKKTLARLFRRTLFCFWYPIFPTTSKNNNFELLARDLVVCGWVVGGERERDPPWARARWWLWALGERESTGVVLVCWLSKKKRAPDDTHSLSFSPSCSCARAHAAPKKKLSYVV